MKNKKPTYSCSRGAKLAEIEDMSREKIRSATSLPPPSRKDRRSGFRCCDSISTRRNPLPRRPSCLIRRPRGAKLAEFKERGSKNPFSLTPPPSPSRKLVDLEKTPSPPALPDPAGDSPDRSDPKLFRRLTDYYYYKQPNPNLPRCLPDYFYHKAGPASFDVGTGDVAAVRSEAAPDYSGRRSPKLCGNEKT